MSVSKSPKSFRHIPVISTPAPMGSYSPDDVVFLLKDIGDYIQEQGNIEREKAIQNGRHYSEMLPIEYKPASKYIDLFHKSLQTSAYRIALATGIVAKANFQKTWPENSVGFPSPGRHASGHFNQEIYPTFL
jgi:hypothetical protein